MELGERWHCGGARAWSVPLGGAPGTWQLEFRANGRLRTNWGWGDWKLFDGALNGVMSCYLSRPMAV